MNEQGLLGVNLETNDSSVQSDRRERRADRRCPCSALPAELFHAAESTMQRMRSRRAHRNQPPCCQASRPNRPFRHRPLVAMCQSFSGPSGSQRRRRCVGTVRRRSALSPRRRRYWPCCPPGSSPSFQVSTRPSRSRRRRRDRPSGGALQEPLQRFSLIPGHVLHDISSQFGEEGFLPSEPRRSTRAPGALKHRP